MMIRFQQTVLATVILAFTIPGAGAQEIVLHKGDTLDDLRMTWDGNNPEARLEINTDKQFVSEGTSSIFAGSVVPEDSDITSYIAFRLSIESIDLNNQALVFEVWSSEPENTIAFHVRGLNAQGKIVAGWSSWSRPLDFEKQTMILVHGEATEKLLWEEAHIEVPESEVVFLEFIAGSRFNEQPYNFYVDNIRLVPSDMASE